MNFTLPFFKTKIIILFCTVLIQLATLTGQAQMRQVSIEPLPSNFLRKISFYSASEGYCVFQDVGLKHTSDSGKTFTTKAIPNSIINSNGYPIASYSTFLSQGVKAFNKDTLLVYGRFDSGPAILYSSDQGASYRLSYYNDVDTSTFIDLNFPVDHNIGFAVDKDRIVKTTDKGLNWTTVWLNYTSTLNFIEGVDNNVLFAFSTGASTSKLLKTINSGTSWQLLNIPSGRLRYATFVNPNTGWLSMVNGTDSILYYTINGGTNWIQKNNTTATPFAATKMKFINDSTGYGIGALFKLYKTTDSGKVWEPFLRDNSFILIPSTHNDLQLLNNIQLWAGGGHGLLELNTNAAGVTLPKAYFNIDTINLFNSGIVNLINYSKPNYQYKWYRNNILISTNYNTSYIHNLSVAVDTIKLVVIKGSNSDTIIKYQYFYVFSPSINNVSPLSASAGSTITITGLNFLGTTAVSFGGVAATSFTVVSSSVITAFLGTGATGSISVTTAYGTVNSGLFTFIAPPTITSFTPTTGTNGTIVTITGSNFVSPATVSFGGALTFTNTVVLPTTITAPVSNGSSGSVSVTTIAGTASMPGFTYYATPTVTSITPNIGASGIPVNIIGTGFTGATSVTIGGVPVTSLTINSATSITAIVGAGVSGNVVVINPVTFSNSSINFTFTNAPVISSFSPISGSIGTIVTISGSNFSSIPSENIVYFGAVKANVLSSMNNSLTIQVPAGATYQPISVTRPTLGLTGHSSSPFNVTFPTDPAAFNNNSFGGRIDFSTDTRPYDVAIGDIDGDGKPDLVTANIISGTVSIFKNTSSTSHISFATRIDITMAAFIKRIHLSDIDGDGKLDIVFSTGSINGSGTPQIGISIVKNLSISGNILFDTIKTISSPVYNNFIVIGDFNLDGKPDIASAPENIALITTGGNNNGAFINVYKNTSLNGVISFSVPQQFGLNLTGGASSSTYSEMRIADLNNDKKNDIVLGASSSDFFIVFENTSTYNSFSFSPKLIGTNNGGSGRLSPVVADFDEDGQKDIITNQLIHRNLGNFIFSSLYTPSLNNNYGGFFCDDLNGDGKPDFASTSIVNNILALGINKNISTPNNILFTSGFNYLVGTAGGAYKSGDIDSDGKPEIIFIDPNLNLVSILKNMIGITQVCAGSNTSFTSDITGTSYQWQVDTGSGFTNISNNANYVGTNTITLQLINVPSLWNGYKYRCVINGTSMSNIFSITVNGVTPTVSISSPNTSICAGTSVTFTAIPINAGSTPTYQWQVNGVNLGSNSNSFTSTNFNNNDQVKVILTSNSSCSFGLTTTSNIITITVSTILSTSTNINVSNNAICSGTSATFTATTTNGGTTPSYQWLVNNINTGTNSNTFTSSTLTNNDQVKVILTSSLLCALPIIATSNIITMSVLAVPIANAGNDISICTGNNTQLSGSGGITYSWSPLTGLNNPNIANPIATLTATTAYILTVSNGNNCSSKDTVVVTVNQPTAPAVNISTPSNNICLGNVITFTALPTNGGTNPAFQWQVNGVNAGINSNTFTSNAINNTDQVKTILTSNSACTTTPTATSNVITMAVQQLAVPLVTLSNRVYTITNPDAGATYTWQTTTNGSWANVVPVANSTVFTASAAGEYRVMAVKGSCITYSQSQITNRRTAAANNAYGIYLYPNPANGMITLDSIQISQNWETMEITNAEGKHVLPSFDIKNKNTVLIDVSSFRNGVYFITLRRKNGEFTTIKFVKH
jgi:large repetitive protein